MASRQQFSPLCDLHHVPMRRVMLEEDAEEVRSYHACERRDCTRIFRAPSGYSDLIEDRFDDSRASTQRCPRCGSALYLADVDHARKIETWDCPEANCDYSGDSPSPSAR
jgi:ribosomal protein S27AE